MPSIFTLEGPRLPATGPQLGQTKSKARTVLSFVIGLGAIAAGVALYRRRKGQRKLGDASMIKIIASESRSPAEYARRIEAWNAAEAKPLPVAKLARAYRGAKPEKIARLIREARETREEGRERLWTKMSRGLRGIIPNGVAKRQHCTTRDVDPKQLKIGTEVELEHTSSRKVARQIALDHLCETPRYYTAGDVQSERLVLKRGEYRKLARKAGLDGYRVAYGTSDSQGTYRTFDPHVFETLDAAMKQMRQYKRQAFWTWIEDDQGNFVPVPGAKTERARKAYPLRK